MFYSSIHDVTKKEIINLTKSANNVNIWRHLVDRQFHICCVYDINECKLTYFSNRFYSDTLDATLETLDAMGIKYEMNN